MRKRHRTGTINRKHKNIFKPTGEGNGNPLQYSCLENPMDRGAWWATVHGVAKSRTRLSNFTFMLVILLNIKTKHSSYKKYCQTRFFKSQLCIVDNRKIHRKYAERLQIQVKKIKRHTLYLLIREKIMQLH